MREVILRVLESNSPIKAVDLALHVIERITPKEFETSKYHDALKELICDREIKDLVYLDIDNVTKHIYFRKESYVIGVLNESSNESGMVRESKRDAQIPFQKEEGK
jgi:hypothetical protein